MRQLIVGFGVSAAILGAVFAAPAGAQAPPVVDGNIDDLVNFATTIDGTARGCGLARTTNADDVCTDQFSVLIPCSELRSVDCGMHFDNGYDLIEWAVAYDRQSGIAYFGTRVDGVIGDADGDGTDGTDNPGACVQTPTITDPAGISSGEDYTWAIDTDCVGGADVFISVFGGAGTGIPTVRVRDALDNDIPGIGATSAQYVGSDLEVSVQGLALPPIFRASAFVGASGAVPDGLAEDGDGPVQCTVPPASLEIEKTANPEVLCPGESTTFTVVVENTGALDLTVTLTDLLPDDLTFDGNVVGDFSLQGQSGQELTFNDLVIPVGESRSVSFDASAGQECFGEVTNVATAIGIFQSNCLINQDNPEGTIQVGPVMDDAIVTCTDDPCVTVSCSGPEAACDGDQITIEAEATNCSRGPEDITVNIAGQETTFVAVPAGSTVTWSRQLLHECPEQPLAATGGASALAFEGTGGPTGVTYVVTATATNDCGTTATEQDICDVECSPEPCVTVDAEGPEAICTGDDVTILASATNCSDGAEDITINIAGQESTFVDVPSGATVEYSATFEGVQCDPAEPLLYDVTATATNVCDTVEQSTTVEVECLPGACVTVEARGPEAICSGDDVTIMAEATNCSDGAEDITINIAGQESTFVDVASGATVQYSATFEGVQCTEEEPLEYLVTATATNTCNTVEQSTTVEVDCLPEPCVEITDVSAPMAICTDGDVTIEVTAQNCSNGAEDITINIAGRETTFVDVPSGESRTYSTTFENVECVEGRDAVYEISATAENECGVAGDDDSVTVSCNPEPCVEIEASGPESACEGAEIELCLRATNCSNGAEDITINIAGQETTFVAVPAEGEVEWCVTVTVPQCAQGQDVRFDASAVATNECGEVTQTTTIAVRCDEPEVNIVKTASVEVSELGETYSYRIEVSNPGPVDLENLTITDNLCEYVSYQNNASPTPDIEPVVGEIGGTIVWTLPSLAVGQTAVFTFDVQAESCDVTCLNEAIVLAYCSGSETSSVEARDDEDTPIRCIAENCPRTPGYWSQQVDQKGNGSTKLTVQQVTDIADCIRGESDWFDGLWGDSFDGFKAAIVPPRPMDPFKQLQRHFAALLANYCSGRLDIINDKGQPVSLDLSTPIDCPGVDADNIGELIEEIDQALLSGDSGKYNVLLECADRINNGIGIPLAEECRDDEPEVEELNGSRTLGGATILDPENQLGETEELLQLYSPAPNPFTSATRLAYAVPGAGSRIEIGIYNVAGRQVRKLVSGFQASGRYEVTWDGRDDAGIQMSRGVYFVRAQVDGQLVGNAPRVILAR